MIDILRRALLLLPLSVLLTHADDNNHVYEDKEIVTLWVNTVGPYHNPQETYSYYSLPFCKPSDLETKKRPSGIGEILEGHELTNSGFLLHFATDIQSEVFCELEVDEEVAQRFETAIDQQYWYEMFLDDLPMWGMVGETLRDPEHGKMEKHIFTHRSLNIAFNQNRIIEVNLTSENPVPIEVKSKIKFTYSVHWTPTQKPFEKRFERYLEYDFFEHQIHWFSVFNSFMMVVFLCGLVVLILLRTLRNDFARYAKDDLDVEGMHVMGEDSGWKQVHGDVFRAPEQLILFTAMYGTGWQLLALVLGVIVYAMAGPLHGHVYEDRGEMVSTVIVCYAFSSAVAGYTSGAFYKQFFTTPRSEQTSQWQKAMVATILLFPSLVIVVVFVLNMISFYYSTISAIPIIVIIKIAVIWALVALPLSIAGTIFGRHSFGGKREAFPCRVNAIPRPIPPSSWWAAPAFVIPISGLLPFGSIFIEMYFVFTAFWSYKFYYVYGFLLLVYCILVMVTICTTIVATYFVLNSENHRWHWTAFQSAGSTAGYVFIYSIYFFVYKTQMSGILQVMYYFGYMFTFSFALFLMCGTVGTWGASYFVNKIYRNVKID